MESPGEPIVQASYGGPHSSVPHSNAKQPDTHPEGERLSWWTNWTSIILNESIRMYNPKQPQYTIVGELIVQLPEVQSRVT